MIQRRGYGRELLRQLTSRFSTSRPSDQPPPLGLIAGWGSFPVEVAEQVVASGRRIYCVAITDHAQSDLESICDHVKWSGVGKIGSHIAYFRRHGVREVTMAGKLFKSELLFQGSVWIKHCPDLTAIRTFGPCLLGSRPDSRDDSLLTAVTNTYAKKSLTICPATDFAPELLVNQGHLIGKPLTAKQSRDVEFGWQVAKQMGGMDIGQSITIKDSTVLAVEAVEGTDACIERTGQLCRRGGWTLVKVSKPNQDMRFDVPTIGPQTVTRVAENGGVAIAVEADKTILVERETTLRLAKQHGVTIVALTNPSQRVAAA
ncbi:UDP-2,3-diacylglucosamine diphosphatase LpxI [Stieleria sp. TO1_6]|uniref:LpxI family protein n=1 Tax=Stieleria tagensis TaxID=2956795 RepID=UPI00209B4582|nr:UDP-2,3-diacylglucosamine diphosphatase LpxI [Stieleria tagensis]MCO8122037.1 UDP-2,3-diacylglucosamine diphosphatase LpxI [Stieleria tagensis]